MNESLPRYGALLRRPKTLSIKSSSSVVAAEEVVEDGAASSSSRKKKRDQRRGGEGYCRCVGMLEGETEAAVCWLAKVFRFKERWGGRGRQCDPIRLLHPDPIRLLHPSWPGGDAGRGAEGKCC